MADSTSETRTGFPFPPPANGVLVETTRLQCLQPRPSDLDLLRKLFMDPAMTAYLGGPAKEEAVTSWLAEWESKWASGESFCGIVALRSTGERIGSASIHPSTVPDLSGVEISYVILPAYQQMGFAIEISIELVRYAFENMRSPRVLITADPDHEVSNKIARRLGFQCFGELHYEHSKWENHSRHFVWKLEKAPQP